MNDSIFVEFVFTNTESEKVYGELATLGEDLNLTKSFHTHNNVVYVYLTGKINSNTATVIKLGSSILSDKMRVSYISNELKNKYRTEHEK